MPPPLMSDFMRSNNLEEAGGVAKPEGIAGGRIKIRSDRHVNQHRPGLTEIQKRLLSHGEPAVRYGPKVLLVDTKSKLRLVSGSVHHSSRIEVGWNRKIC